MIELKNGTASGCPIVFLHGFLEDNSMWNFLQEEDFSTNPLCFIELPGHGNSHLALMTSLSEMAKEIHNAVLNSGFKECKVVGHSLGGYIVMELVKIAPEFYKKAILLNSHPFADSPQKKIDRSRVVDIVGSNKELFLKTAIPNLFLDKQKHESSIESLISASLKMHIKAIQASTIAMRDRRDNSELLARYPSKFEIIYGEFDTLVPIQVLQENLKNLNFSIHVIAEGGHMCHIENRQDTLVKLKELLD